MSVTSGTSLSLAALFADREAHRRREQEAEKELQRKQAEELSEYRKRLENFELTPEKIQFGLERIRRAFERGETEVMFTSFPSSFCSDGGRAINNQGEPPINKPTKEEQAKLAEEPEWVATLPAGARKVFEYWKANLKPGGFGFSARIINYPGGIPGDVGLFFTWPKSSLETKP